MKYAFRKKSSRTRAENNVNWAKCLREPTDNKQKLPCLKLGSSSIGHTTSNTVAPVAVSFLPQWLFDWGLRLHRVSEKTAQTVGYLSELRKISMNFNNFWLVDDKKAEVSCYVYT